MHAAAIGQTIAVMDKSGKVVSTSKHLINVFKEAKLAYRERKAEIVAERRTHLEEKRMRHALEAYTIEDDDPTYATSSRRSHKSRSKARPNGERRHSSRSTHGATSPIYPAYEYDYEQDRESHRHLLGRSQTFQHENLNGVAQRASLGRSMSTPAAIDMDLAYGEIPPPLPPNQPEELELKGLVGKVKMLLDEAECAQYSVTAIIANLQKNPDAMAAVALTLAEISNIVTKMSPGVITALKGSAPAVFALLASPQFMIAAGVGVGITIVAFGGYKIIKKIKARNAQDDGMDEMLEIGGDVNRIETWRRGIAETEVESTGTSVDGEFITPQAAFMSREALHEDESRKQRKEIRSKKPAKTSRSGTSKSSNALKPEKEKKTKKPSPLRLMFK